MCLPAKVLYSKNFLTVLRRKGRYMRQVIKQATLLMSGVLLLGLVPTGPTQAMTVTSFTTDQSLLGPSINNRGTWSPDIAGDPASDSYFLGEVTFVPLQFRFRNFFTFDLTSLSGTATAAFLRIDRGTDLPGNESTETIEFFDVSTDAVTLNNNQGLSQAIFEDLGTGVSYGSFTVLDDRLQFGLLLNEAGLADINAANGFFSIGGSLITNDGNDGFFSGDNLGTTELRIVTVPTVSLPSTMLLFGLSFVVFVAWRYREEKIEKN